ncbi:MAG: ABC transporter permease, partial [Chloroflexota bacterium]
MKPITRTLSFFSQWMAEVFRQPWLMVVLVIGPIAILLLFGEGENVGAQRPRAMLVLPSGQTSQQSALGMNQKALSTYLDVVGVTSSPGQARADLSSGRVDLVVIPPVNPLQTIEQGRHARVTILTNLIDPVQKSYADAYIREQIAALNERAVRKTIAQTQSSAGTVRGFVGQARKDLQLLRSAHGDIGKARSQIRQVKAALDPLAADLNQAVNLAQGLPLAGIPGLGGPLSQLKQLSASVNSLSQTVHSFDRQLSQVNGAVPLSSGQIDQLESQLTQIEQAAGRFKTIPAQVLSAPFALDLRNVAPFQPNTIGFYAPAVLALLLQHLAITLGALSMSRVRILGLMELFQTSPVKPLEVILGTYMSYGSLCIIAGGLLVALLLLALGVPLFGSTLAFVGILLLLIFCSLGIGVLISMVSSSEQQAVQLAMLVLIASVFFGGFLVAMSSIVWPARIVSYALPVTYAIRTLQDVMLRGTIRMPYDFAILGGAGVV